MSIIHLLEKLKKIQRDLLAFLDNNVNEDKIIFEHPQDSNEIKLFLRLISNICNNHHRMPNFFRKIEFVIKQFREDILELFPNSEIFDIFQNNKRILLFLIKEKMLIIDKYIAKKIITERKYIDAQYPLYFAPEIKPFMEEEWFPKKSKFNFDKWINQLYEQMPADFEAKRIEGESDNYLNQLIRQDLIDEFVIHVNQTCLQLDSMIKSSEYETNNFLIQKSIFYEHTSLIEYAAFYGSIQIFNYLRLNNVKLKSSLWLYAIHSNNPELIHLLEENEVELKDKLKEECFIESIKCHHNNISTYFKDVYSQNIDSSLKKILKYHNYEFIQESFINKTIFLELCRYDYYLFVQFLLENEKGIDINMQLPITKKGDYRECEFAAIHFASKNNNIEILKLLLSYPNINVNIQTSCGFAALHYAVKRSNIEMIKCLLSMPKIHVNIRNISAKKEYAFGYTPLHFAVQQNDIDIVKLLLSMPKINVNIQTSSFVCPDDVDRGFTALHMACLNNRIEIIKLLLAMPNIDVNIQSSKSGRDGDGFYSRSFHEGFTALHFATSGDYIDTAKLLLKMPKIDVNIQTSSNRSALDKFTPLHFAAENDNTEMVKLLLSMPNINVNLRTSSMGFTALHFACKNNNTEMVKLLLSMPNIKLKIKSAPPDYCATLCDFSYRSMTPLKIAIDNKNFEIINLFAESQKIKVNMDDIKKKISNKDKTRKLNRWKYIHARFEEEEDDEEEEEDEGKNF